MTLKRREKKALIVWVTPETHARVKEMAQKNKMPIYKMCLKLMNGGLKK